MTSTKNYNMAKQTELNPLNIWMGKRFETLRENAGISKNELFKRLEISRMVIVNAEQGKNMISNWLLFNASIIFGVHVAEFFPAQDKNGNFITQGEYRQLSISDPVAYPPVAELTIEPGKAPKKPAAKAKLISAHEAATKRETSQKTAKNASKPKSKSLG